MSESLKAQGTRAFLWDFSGKLAMQGTGFVVSIFLARLLEPADFGLVAMVMVILGIAGIFSDIGLGGALVQRRRVLPVHYSSVFYFNIAVASLLTIMTYISAPLIAEFYHEEKLVLLTEVISVSFILGALRSVHVVQFRKNLQYKKITQITFFSSLMGGIVGVGLAFMGAGVWSLVAQQLLSGLISVAMVWRLSTWRPTMLFSFKALLQLWGFGFRMFLSALLDTIFSRLDTLIIGKMFSAAALGFFNRAKALDQLVISYSSGSLMGVLFPVLSKVQNDLPRFQNIVLKALGIICFVTFFLLGFLYLTSEELIVMLFSEKWLPSVDMFEILVMSGFAYPVSALLVNVLSSRGNSKAFLHVEIYKKIIAGLNLYIGFLWGIEGYLYGLVLASAIAVYLNIAFAAKEIQLSKRVFIEPIVIQAAITILLVGIVWLLLHDLQYMHIINLVLKGGMFFVLYIGVNYLLYTTSYQYFMEQFHPLLKKVLKKDVAV